MDPRLTPLFAVLTLPVGILTGLFVGLQPAVAVFVIGWLLLTPASAILLGGPGEEGMAMAADTESTQEPTEDPIDRLRRRYADGEITEAELERQLEALLETEDVTGDDTEQIERTIDRLDGEREMERE